MAEYKQHALGKRAENYARRYLETKGLILLEMNYTCYHGEIDLVMQDQDMIVFTEVRYRNDDRYGNALESINQQKIKKLTKSAIHYLQRNKLLYRVTSRFDIIAIQRMSSKLRVEWFKNAFTIESDL